MLNVRVAPILALLVVLACCVDVAWAFRLVIVTPPFTPSSASLLQSFIDLSRPPPSTAVILRSAGSLNYLPFLEGRNCSVVLNDESCVERLLSGEGRILDNNPAFLSVITGLHLKEKHLSHERVEEVVKYCAKNKLGLSFSCHELRTVEHARTLQSCLGFAFDFALIGTVFLSASHPEKSEDDLEGLKFLSDAAEMLDESEISAIAIGGIKAKDDCIAAVKTEGAAGAAVIGELFGTSDVNRTCREFARAFGWGGSLEEAYMKTSYEVPACQDPSCPACGLELRVGEKSEQLEQIMIDSGLDTWAFLTAENPRSVMMSREENIKRNEILREELANIEGVRIFEGRGRGLDGKWPAEASFLVLGVSIERALALGRR